MFSSVDKMRAHVAVKHLNKQTSNKKKQGNQTYKSDSSMTEELNLEGSDEEFTETNDLGDVVLTQDFNDQGGDEVNASSSNAFQDHDSKGKRTSHCPICNQMFSSMDNMRAHTASKHYGRQIREKFGISDTSRECPVCSKTSSRTSSLVSHLAYVHNVIAEVEGSQEILKLVRNQ
jgi:hypothetical protein